METLATLRKARKMTQTDMAAALNIPAPTYRAYEYGKAEPSIEKLCQLADILDCSLDELVGREYEPPEPEWFEQYVESIEGHARALVDNAVLARVRLESAREARKEV